jgi:ceramide glucosyltransferase
VLFAVADSDDEAIPVLRQVAADFPERSIRVIVGVAEVGSSSKVSKLCRLAREARHDLVVISDSDITVPRNYLRSVAAPFRDPALGAVTCLYRGAPVPGSGVWAHLEAIGISTDFAPGVVVARWLEGVKFTLGATMATRKAQLAEIGGFEALADYCADDFELGRRIVACGYRIELADCTVSTEAAPRGFDDFFKHQLRWAITLRHSRPGAYAGRTLVTGGLPWALAAAMLAPSAGWAAAHLMTYAMCRFWMAWTVGARGLRDDTVRRGWPLIPVYDAAASVVAIVAFGVNRIEWRGRHFRMRRGRLIPIA